MNCKLSDINSGKEYNNQPIRTELLHHIVTRGPVWAASHLKWCSVSQELHREPFSPFLFTFYTTDVVFWDSGTRATKSLDKIIKKAGSVPSLRLQSFENVVVRRRLNKLLSIIDNDQQPLHHTVDRWQITFPPRLLQHCCQRNRYRKSLLPHAITLYNNHGHNIQALSILYAFTHMHLSVRQFEKCTVNNQIWDEIWSPAINAALD